MDSALDPPKAMFSLEPTNQAFMKSLEILARVDRSSVAYRRQMQCTRHTICGALKALQKSRASSSPGVPCARPSKAGP